MIKHVTIHITKNCNLNCEFCHVAAVYGGSDHNQIDKKLLENLFVPSLKSISIAGGEPFFVKEKLYGFLAQVPEYIESIAVTTNGLLVTESDIEILKAKNIRLQISLDGTFFHHEKNRGSNTFNCSLNTLKKAIRAGIRVDVLTTVTKNNMNDIAEYIKSIDDLGIQNITLLHFTPKGRGAYQPEQEVTQAEWIYYCLNLHKKLDSIRTRVWIQPRFMVKDQIIKLNPFRTVQLCNCHRFEYAYVDIDDGKVYPCGLTYGTPLEIGSLQEENLMQLTQRALSQANVPDVCRNCKNVSLCKGGAKCYSWLCNGNIDEKDPFCTNGNILPICPFPAEYVAGPGMKTDRPTII